MKRKIIDGWVIGEFPFSHGLIYCIEGWYEVTIDYKDDDLDPYISMLYYAEGDNWDKYSGGCEDNGVVAYRLAKLSKPYGYKEKEKKEQSSRNKIEQEGYEAYKPVTKNQQIEYDKQMDSITFPECSYERGTDEYFMWADGWNEAYEEQKREFKENK